MSTIFYDTLSLVKNRFIERNKILEEFDVVSMAEKCQLKREKHTI